MPKRAIACLAMLVVVAVAALFVWEIVAVPRDLSRPELGDEDMRAYVIPTGKLEGEDDAPLVFGNPLLWNDYAQGLREKSGRDLQIPRYGPLFFAGHDVVVRYFPTGEDDDRLILVGGGTEDGCVVAELDADDDWIKEDNAPSTEGGVVVAVEVPNDAEERFLRVRMRGEGDEDTRDEADAEGK